MARRKKDDVESGLTDYSTVSDDVVMDESLFREQVSKISEKMEFSDLDDRFHFLLKLSEEDKRDYIKVTYKGKKVEVRPIGAFKKSGKYILKTKTGDTIIASVSELG